MKLELQGKAALVTGSSRGIGRALAEGLLREGARVCLCARGGATLEATRASLASLGEVTAIAADVATADGASRVVAHAIQTFGALDILINNVGGSRGTGGFDQVDEAKWREVVDTNLLSPVLVSRPAVEWMKAHGGGCILHVSSIYGREYAPSAPTTAAKAGLIALAKEMAVDLARHGIRVNSVAPGSILFEGGSWHKRQQSDPERIAKMVRDELPFGRFGRLDEVADVVTFLCSPRASLISGACIVVDGAQGKAF